MSEALAQDADSRQTPGTSTGVNDDGGARQASIDMLTRLRQGTDMKHTLDYVKLRLGRPIEEDGATAVEYGIMVALIAIVIIGAVALLGDNLQAVFSDVADTLGDPVAGVEQNVGGRGADSGS